MYLRDRPRGQQVVEGVFETVEVAVAHLVDVLGDGGERQGEDESLDGAEFGFYGDDRVVAAAPGVEVVHRRAIDQSGAAIAAQRDGWAGFSRGDVDRCLVMISTRTLIVVPESG